MDNGNVINMPIRRAKTQNEIEQDEVIKITKGCHKIGSIWHAQIHYMAKVAVFCLPPGPGPRRFVGLSNWHIPLRLIIGHQQRKQHADIAGLHAILQ